MSNETRIVAKYVGSRQCDIPISQRYPQADPGTIIPFAIATILFVIRMVTKAMHLGGGWGSDDYTLMVAYVRLPYCILVHECH
jgi:hypothetical protein